MAETGFVRPTLSILIDRTASDINSRLGNVDARVPRTVPFVFGRVLAGVAHLIYGFIADRAKQILPDTATGDDLRRLATIWLAGGAKPATVADNGMIRFSGAPGSPVGIGVVVQRIDGVQYETTAAGVLDGGGHVSLAGKCKTAGATGNAAGSTSLALVTPLAGVSSTATVSSVFDNGVDAENDDDLRARILDRIQTPPQGGSVADYVDWVKATAGVSVRGVYVSPAELGPGTVVVRFTVNGAGAACIPGGGAVAAVQAAVDAVRPVTADVTVAAPAGLAVTLEMHVEPNTADVKAAVTAELDALIAREAKPTGTIKNSNIREAISRATGETSHTLTAINGGSPLADIVQTATQVAYLSTITWV